MGVTTYWKCDHCPATDGADTQPWHGRAGWGEVVIRIANGGGTRKVLLCPACMKPVHEMFGTAFVPQTGQLVDAVDLPSRS